MEKFILLAVGAAMALTLGPTLFHLLREKRLRVFLSHQFTRVGNRLRRRRPVAKTQSSQDGKE
jgi:hypothetical protein